MAGAGGNWTGSIIDARGYQGSLELDLTVQGDQVSGRYRVAIADRGEPFVCDGELSGTDRERLELHFAFGPAEAEVRVTFSGRVLNGGAGICGTYEVDAQTFSPFRAGVAVLCNGASIPTVEGQTPMLGPAVGGG
jgi:hypothetical protein